MQCIAKYVSIAVSRGFPRSSARMWGDEKEDGAKPLRQPRGRKAKPNSGSQKKYASFSLVNRQLPYNESKERNFTEPIGGDEKEDGAKPLRQPKGRKAKP